MTAATASVPAAVGLRLGPMMGALAFLGTAVVIGITVGPANIPATGALLEVLDHVPFVEVDSGLSDVQAAIVWQLRVPRVVLGALVGAVLAVSGGAYQGVFRNPLADPYLLGAAAGAGLGATLLIVAGSSPAGFGVPAAAFIGAVLAVVVAYLLGAAGGGRKSGVTLILAGVAVAAFFTAIQTYVQQRSADSTREVFSWILGRLATVGWAEVRLLLPYALVSVMVLLASRRLLDVLSVGEEEAATLGLSAERVRLLVVGFATLGTAAAVAVSGLIAFVGIIVPHAIRLVAGTSYRVVLPLAVVAGAGFLVIVDVVARAALAPGEIPIGVVTAFLGAPFFAIILRRSRRGT